MEQLGLGEVLMVLAIPGAIGCYLAWTKGRRILGWTILCGFFFPAILPLILLPPTKEIPGRYRQCPSCKQYVKWKAMVCEHCLRSL